MSQLNLLKAGDYVTVLEWVRSNDRSYTRDCFQISVIDNPLVRLKTISKYSGEHGKMITLDEREVVFKRLSDEFVASVLLEIK